MPITSRAAACGDTPQKIGKNKPRGRRPKVPRSQTPPFVYQPGMKIAEGKDIETPCAKKVSTYSAWWIKSYIRHSIRNAHAVFVPRTAHDLVRRWEAARARFRAANAFEPTDPE